MHEEKRAKILDRMNKIYRITVAAGFEAAFE
jgi:hypothetical protein